MGTILETRDYDRFVFVHSNRVIKRKRVLDWKRILSVKNLMHCMPLVANRSYQLLDGQHRLTAARELGIPVNYTISDSMGVEDIADANSKGHGWKSTDHIHHYACMENRDYMMLETFLDKYKIGVTMAAGLLMGGGEGGVFHTRAITNGTFKIKDWEHACEVADHIYAFRPYVKHYKHSHFMRAIATVYDHKDYEPAKMLKKIEYLSSRLKRHPDTIGYIENIEEIYNHKNQQKVRFT